ncbi:MAG: leucine-rich repeat protein, partial [Muribaculaceae bacterium]|nr:leucine-rich repeat protein [Muribaculaceae bacterium]
MMKKLSGYTLADIVAQSMVFILSVALFSCSMTEDPPNIEPEIILKEATEVSRTEATIGARIIRQEGTVIDFIRFCYGVSGAMEVSEVDIKPAADDITFRLTGLRPGTEYHYRAEGGTSSATVSSGTLFFSTVPNELPSVSPATPLSSGPVGLIVGFEIIEDGGEPITESGCDIMNVHTGESRRLIIETESAGTGRKQVRINGLTPLTEYLITPFASNSVGEAYGEPLSHTTGNSVRLENPGDLPLLFGPGQVNLDKISISGKMNGTDFHFLRRMLEAPLLPGEDPLETRVEEVDITDVEITEGGESYDGSRFTVKDEISTFLFADCCGLQCISLPSSATRIGRDAFKGCSALKMIEIPAGVEELLPSSGCNALEEINVSDANINYKSIEGVLFNMDASAILWFPEGKKGEFNIPSSVSEIGENAFRGTSISSIVLPPDLTAIARGAFSGSSLTEITLPERLANISEGMFQDCPMLLTVRLGTGVEFIGNYAFDGSPLKDLYIKAVYPPFVSDNSFRNSTHNLYDNCVLHVPASSLK